MASEVIEGEAVLTGLTDINLNNSSPDVVTPSRSSENMDNRETSSPSSSGVSGDDEDLNELQTSAASVVENDKESGESPTKTKEVSQKRTGNVQIQPAGRMVSTPVTLHQSPLTPEPTGRSVFFLFGVCSCQLWVEFTLFLNLLTDLLFVCQLLIIFN